MVEREDLEADIREVEEVVEEQREDKEETRGNGEVFSTCGDATVVVMSEITPLLDSAIPAVHSRPKMNIFSVSYPRSRSKVTIINLLLFCMLDYFQESICLKYLFCSLSSFSQFA